MEIVIYDCHSSSQPSLLQPTMPAAVTVALPLPRRSLGVGAPQLSQISHNLGYNLLIVAFAGALYAASPSLINEFRYRFTPKPAPVTVKANFGQIIKDEKITKEKLAKEEADKYGVSTDFSIVIPKINAKARIVPNVLPGNKDEYLEALKQGVAHASGSGFPGGQNDIFLFSHSTNADYNIDRFNAVFYLLKEMVVGDKIIIFYAGQKFEYQVSASQIVKAEDTSWLETNSGQGQLVLSTCWPPGTSLKRLIVIAKPI